MGGVSSRDGGPESPRGYDDRSPPDSPLVTPRSPLTFGCAACSAGRRTQNPMRLGSRTCFASRARRFAPRLTRPLAGRARARRCRPQVPMAPMPQPTDFSLGGSGHYNPDFPTVSWPAQPTLVPTPIVCACPGTACGVWGAPGVTWRRSGPEAARRRARARACAHAQHEGCVRLADAARRCRSASLHAAAGATSRSRTRCARCRLRALAHTHTRAPCRWRIPFFSADSDVGDARASKD
jgi:hypothetical protein